MVGSDKEQSDILFVLALGRLRKQNKLKRASKRAAVLESEHPAIVFRIARHFSKGPPSASKAAIFSFEAQQEAAKLASSGMMLRSHAPPLNAQSRRHMGQCCRTVWELSHLTMQCIWKACVHLPHTGGQSSPGILQSGQHASKGLRQIPQVSS